MLEALAQAAFAKVTPGTGQAAAVTDDSVPTAMAGFAHILQQGQEPLPDLPVQAFLAEAVPPAVSGETGAMVDEAAVDADDSPEQLLQQLQQAQPDTANAQAGVALVMQPAQQALDNAGKVGDKAVATEVVLPLLPATKEGAAEVARLPTAAPANGSLAASSPAVAPVLSAAPILKTPLAALDKLAPLASSNPSLDNVDTLTPSLLLPGQSALTPTTHPGLVMRADGALPPQALPELAQQAVALIRQHGHDKAEARLSLHPAELGQMDLKLEQNGQRLDLSVTVDNEPARRAMQDHIHQLRERLSDAGMQLGSLDIDLRDQSGRRQDNDAPIVAHSSSEAEAVKKPAERPLHISQSALDLYA